MGKIQKGISTCNSSDAWEETEVYGDAVMKKTLIVALNFFYNILSYILYEKYTCKWTI